MELRRVLVRSKCSCGVDFSGVRAPDGTMDARPMARYFPRLIARCYSQAVPALCTVPRRHGDEAQHLAAACVLHVKHVAWQRLPMRDAAQDRASTRMNSSP